MVLTLDIVVAQNGTLAQEALVENPTRVAGLEPLPAEDGYIIYEHDQDRVHYLNPVAALIFELCNGECSVAEIVGMVQETFGLAEAPVTEVSAALEKMKAEGLLQ
jgi:hypothetical protein